MDISQIRELIRGGESARVEFKKTISSSEKIAKALSAFANSRGGLILVGVQDNKDYHLINPEEEKFMIQRAADFYCYPSVPVDYYEVEDEGFTLLLVRVKESRNKPHAIKDRNGETRVYVRSDDKCLLASASIVDMLRKSNPEDEVADRKLSRNEMALLHYLKQRHRITLKDYAKLVNISKRRAYKILRELMSGGWIYEHDYNQACYYTLATS